MDKVDLRKSDKRYYMAQRQPELIELASAMYLATSGQGDPGGAEFATATQALYTVAYAIKAATKASRHEFIVPYLEGLWWVERDRPILEIPREEWRWQLMIRLPEFVAHEQYEQGLATAQEKKPALTTAIGAVLFESLHEAQAVQMLHVGPYATEPATVAAIEDFIHAHHLRQAGLHHEIYISDPRKTAPDKLKTIIRYPVARADTP